MTQIITCENLGVFYKKFHARRLFFSKRARKDPNEKEWALDGLSFSAHTGDIIGLIGRNGAGKSTLTRTLAGIYVPDLGALEIKGSVRLLSLALGFNNELTGLDNIYVSARYQGMKRKEINAQLQEIIDFSELGSKIDEPVKYYSSGMRARLAFSIAVCSPPEVLVMDEVLATGDIGFQEKCHKKIIELSKKVECLIIATHSLPFVSRFCNKILVLEHGRLLHFGNVEEGVQKYTASFQ